MESVRRRLTFANVTSLIALFVALGGGAYAVSLDKNSVKSKHIKDGQVKPGDIKDGGVRAADIGEGEVGSVAITDGSISASDIGTGEVGSAQIANGSIGSSDVGANALDGAVIDEAQLTGLTQACPPATTRFGELCIVPPDGTPTGFFEAIDECTAVGLRLPSYGEGLVLAKNHDVPGVSAATEEFWTDSY